MSQTGSSMRKSKVAVIEHCLVIGMGIALLVHLSLVKKYGESRIVEPNSSILNAEIALLAVIILFGISQLIRGK